MLSQISVFLPNKAGILAKLTKTMMDNQVNIRALTVAETADYGILRMIVDKTDKCVKVLKDNNYLVSLTDVIAVDIPDKPGSLHEIAKYLGEQNVNIEYIYSSLTKDKAVIILRIDDINKAIKVLKDKKVKIVETQEF